MAPKSKPLASKDGDDKDEKEEPEEEETELYQGDTVKLNSSVGEVKRILAAANMKWEPAMGQYLGHAGKVLKIEVKEGKQVVAVQFGGADGPTLALGSRCLEMQEEEEEDEDDEEDDDDEEEEEAVEISHIFRVNEKVRDLVRASKGKIATGTISKMDESKCDIKYDDGSTKTGVPLNQVKPVEKKQSDGTGLTSTSGLNEFDFTKNQLPTGVEYVGEGVDLMSGRGGETHLHVRKGTFLRMPLTGLKHERLRPGEPIASYSLTIELQLDERMPQLQHPWSVFQASFPEVHESDEVSVTALTKPDYAKWKVGTDIDKLAVTAELSVASTVYAELKPGTVIQQCGEVQRLPTGLKRIPVVFKRKSMEEEDELGDIRATAKKDAGEEADGEEEEDDAASMRGGGGMDWDDEECEVEVYAGYWGSSTTGPPTSFKVVSNGITKTISFHPGVEGGAAQVDGEPVKDIGWTPATQQYHILRLTMRMTGAHTLTILDGIDPTKTWTLEFRVHGWLDEIYGAAGVHITDPEERDLELGIEIVYQGEGEHKLKMIRDGDREFATDELDPRGYVNFNRTCLEPYEDGPKIPKGATCHVKVKDTTTDRRLCPGRWHSLTVTVDGVRDEMKVYIDGQMATEEAIDTNEFSLRLPNGMRQRGGSGDGGGESSKRRRGGGVGGGEAEMMMYGGMGGIAGMGFGGGFRQSPYAVPQEGFLLFASQSVRGMPGGVKIRRVIFRNIIMEPNIIEEHYVNSRHKKKRAPAIVNLSLMPILKKKAPPIWLHPAFIAEFCNPFAPGMKGLPHQFFQIFCHAFDCTIEAMDDSGWVREEVDGCRKVLAIFKNAEALYKKYQPLWQAGDAETMAALSATYLKRLTQARAELVPGSRMIVPLGLRIGKKGELCVMIVEKKHGGLYRFVIISSSLLGLQHHAASASQPPKIKYRAALEIDDVPACKAEDEAWWLMLVVTSVQPTSDGAALYDKLIPWLSGVPLEHLLMQQAANLKEDESKVDDAVWEWRTAAKSDVWRSLTFTMRVLLREVANVSLGRAKLLKWQLRKQMITMASNDLAKSRSLSVSERSILRLSLSQLALGSVKCSGTLLEPGGGAPTPVPVLRDAQKFIEEVELGIKGKPKQDGFEDPSVLPISNLVKGADEAPVTEYGLYPFFERLLREQRSPGQKVGVPLLVPINMLAMPEHVSDFPGALRAMRICEELVAKLAFVGAERCKFSAFLRVTLIQQLFTELLPLPIGPIAERAPLNLVDPIWSPNGFDGLHPHMTRGTQFEVLHLLRRLCEHFVVSVACIKASKGFDGVKIIVLGAMAAISDRVVRTRCCCITAVEPEERTSELTELINGVGPANWRPLAVDPVSFLKQSETIEVATPELNITRTAVASYFSEVIDHLEVKVGKDETLFDWDAHGWMLWVSKEKGLKRLVDQLCASHLLEAGSEWGMLAAGSDQYLVRTWPEFACYRDIVFWWKYFLCTDLRVFPKHAAYKPQHGYLIWSLNDEQKAFGSPPNRGKVFVVYGLGKDHLLKHKEMGNRPKPPTSGHRWPSAAQPSQYTKQPVRTEDDLLYMRTLPTFNETVRASDAEALLSFLTVPYIRMPLTFAFFTTGDRVNILFEKILQNIVQAVALEPGRLLEPKRWTESPTTVPAVSTEELMLIATPYGQLLTELACAPGCICAYVAKLVELSLVLANSAMSQTVSLILFVVRLAARVESSIVFLLQHAEGKLKSAGPLPGALPSSPATLAELRAGRRRLRQLFNEVDGWLDSWLEELQELAQTAMQQSEEAAMEANLVASDAKKAKDAAQTQVDEYMRRSCNIQAHVILLLRNVTEEELDARSAGRFLSSFVFLSLHHTFNADFLDMPEPELFEVFHHHRRALVRWFESQQQKREYKVFNSVLQEVHAQFQAIDTSNSVDTKLFEWGVIGGERHNQGRFCIIGPKRSDAERGDVAVAKPDDMSWIELNIQLLQVTVRGRHVTPLEAETCEDEDFQTIMRLGSGHQAETVQCAALLTTNLVRVRELLSQPYRITRWEAQAGNVLPFQGDHVRLYDVEDMEEHESWIATLFEPIRQQFFVRPAVPQDILFFLLEDISPDAPVAMLVGVHPKNRGRVWKEILIFRDLRMVQIFKITGYGWQLYRSLEYTSDARYTLARMQPSTQDRNDPWPDWGRYEAGAPNLELEDHAVSVVLTRTIIRDGGDGSCGKGTKRTDPLDDPDEWSDGEPSDDETEAEKAERTVWERSQREGEQFLPSRLLSGLLPDGILDKYNIYQENEPPRRALRGYPLTEEFEEEQEPDHILEMKLIKTAKVPATGVRGWSAMISKRWKTPGRQPWYLLNLLCAREGTPMHSLARSLVRLEDLSYILAWTYTDIHEQSVDPTIDLIELPRLLLSFTVRREADGTRRLWSLDHAELSMPIGTHTAARTQAAKLLTPIPHSALLETKNEEFFAIVPNIRPHRPHIGSDPFSTELVLERGDEDWWQAAKNKTFLYPVHASNSFFMTPTVASSLYLMCLRWMNRDYGGVASLVSAVGTDTKYEDDELQIYRHLGVIDDPHPDSHGNRMKVTLAVADAGMAWPWDVPEESAGYISKFGHVAARCRLTVAEEFRILELCKQIRDTLSIVQDEVALLRQRFWGQWGQERLKRYQEILADEAVETTANYQEVKEIGDWIRQLLKKLRAQQLPGTKADVKELVLQVFQGYKVEDSVVLELDNRTAYLNRLEGYDGAKNGEALLLTCPERPKESLWQTHSDQNVLLCSLFDLMWDVLGAEKILRPDMADEEGPEIPSMRKIPFPMALTHAFESCQGKISLQDYGSASTTFSLFYCLFSKSTGVRLGRARETQASHQHTYALMMLHMMPGSRNHGVLASLLHIMAQNPLYCESMPQLTKPKKVRLVKQWKQKLSELHQMVVGAANNLQLLWPEPPEAFQELATPFQTAVPSQYLESPPVSRGLCPRLLFCPEIPRIGAAVRGCPSLSSITCTDRRLVSSGSLSREDAAAFASCPLTALCGKYITSEDPTEKISEKMPFSIEKHNLSKHRVAVSMFDRLNREMAYCAKTRNAKRRSVLTQLGTKHVQEIGASLGPNTLSNPALIAARKQLEELIHDLSKLKSQDEAFVAKAIQDIHSSSNDVDLTDGIGVRERLRFWLLRYANLEAPLWFEYMCSGLLSPNCQTDFQQTNPFLHKEASTAILELMAQMMLASSRIVSICRCLDRSYDLLALVKAPASAGSTQALMAGLSEKANVLCALMTANRTFIRPSTSGGSGLRADAKFEGNFDPRFLIFEFVTGFLLRPRQVAMVREFSEVINAKGSVVKQMIMGAGKTSVVSPLMALMFADGSRAVCLVVPQALIQLSRTVLQNAFSTIVQKRVSTFKCDRSLDLEVRLSARINRICTQGDILVSTPGDIKSLQLRFLEQLDLANDRRAKKNTPQLRRECIEMGLTLKVLKDGICMIDEVDLVLHPLRSELNFPVGPKNLIEHSPERWRITLHLLDGFFSVEKDRVPPHLKDSLRAREILDVLRKVIVSGTSRNFLQQSPHLVLLSEEFYHQEMKPIMADWLGLWLTNEHVGRVFEKNSERGDRGLTDDEVRTYVLQRVKPVEVELEATVAEWQAWATRNPKRMWLIDVIEGRSESQTGEVEIVQAELLNCAAPRSEYTARLISNANGRARVALIETKKGSALRGERVERLPPKDVKSMNLGFDWLHIYLPFSLQKIDRVTFGIMSMEQVLAALAEQPLMPLTRAKLAIPFVGKDVPSTSSEFAHPDITIGLTVLAYRYEGLRRNDFDEVLGMLTERLESENGTMMERPTSLLWKNWVEEGGAVFCVKQAELDLQTASDMLAVDESKARPDRQKARVLPLHLLERRNEANMVQLFELMRRLPSAVHFYLEHSVFPQFMRFQDEKLSASGQDLGGSILFGQRIGFSGTPSDLMPRELGQCDFEPGSEGEMVTTMTDPKVVSFDPVGSGWSVSSLLDNIIASTHEGKCSCLIDTGALITGFTNREVAEYLLGFGSNRKGDAMKRPCLPDSVDGVVFLDEDGGKKILLRQTREATKLADSGVPAQKRFAFYDQVHTTGMDIAHKLDAVAALTLGKDMTWRDYVQGAYRMRGIGRGQRIALLVIPEVVGLISRDLELAQLDKQLKGTETHWTASEKGRLLGVAAWLLINSVRTERVQFAMLQLQNLGNIWRTNAFAHVMREFEDITSDSLRKTLQVFKEPIAFVVEPKVPVSRGVQELVEDRIGSMKGYIVSEEDSQAVKQIQLNVAEVALIGDDKEEEAGLETEQQREQEQERQQEQEQEEEREQEIEIEKFVDLMHCRDDEEPDSWNIDTLGSEEKAKQFYEAAQFRLWKRKPLSKLTPEARLSRNWFNPQWSGFRRVKSVFVQLEWTPDISAAVRSIEPLEMDQYEEFEMHRKLRHVWDLLNRGSGLEDFTEEAPQAMVMTPEYQGAEKKLVMPPPPPGTIAKDKVKELLTASFDWDPVLHDTASALSALGKSSSDLITYEEMVRMLLNGRFRTRDENRNFVLLSLAEAETLRRILHARIGKPLLERQPQAALALRCVFANNEILDQSQSFQPGPTFQIRMLHQLARFLDGQTFYRPPELSVLLRAVQWNRPFDRRRFFEGLGSCRRRAGLAHWDQQPVAEVLRPWLEFEQVLSRIRAVRLHAAIHGHGLSVQMAFQRYDANQSGLLEPIEFCRALRDLGFAFDASEVANWIEAVDTNDDYCVDYPEFVAFCKLQVDALMGPAAITFAKTEDVVASATKRVRGPDEALPTPPQLERQESRNKKKPKPEGAVPPAPATLIRSTSDIVRPEEIEEELLERRAYNKRLEAAEARAKAEEEEVIEVLVEEELGTNPKYTDGCGEWDFRGQLLPKDSFALGIVDLMPDGWGQKGTNYLLFDMRSGLAIQKINLKANGDSDRRINKYTLTCWFRTPSLPTKADRMLLLDYPRGDMDPDSGEESKNGAIYIWRGGVIAPEGYNEPTFKYKREKATTHGVSSVTGEWQLLFGGEGREGQKTQVAFTLEPSGRLAVKPSRGAAARRQTDNMTERGFGVKIRLHKDKKDIIDNQFDGVVPSPFDPAFTQLWTQRIRPCISTLIDGRSWTEIGWPCGQNQMRRRLLKDIEKKGEGVIARGLDALSAIRLSRDLMQVAQGSTELCEDRSLEKEPKKGDKVRLMPGLDGHGVLEGEEMGEVSMVNTSGFCVKNLKGDASWFSEKDIVKIDPKELGLAPLTDTEWLAMPSTRSNYVDFSRQLPNPLFDNVWTAKGRAEEVSLAVGEASVKFDVQMEGFVPAYIDATVAYSKDGFLSLEGNWRADDGTGGSLQGTKALTGVALGGLWHIDLQSGADSMEHAWNSWFSCFPGGDGGNIRISGAVLAGPMHTGENVAIPAIPFAGEMTGKGAVKLTFAASESKWGGSTWEGDLGKDRQLRGSWRRADGAEEAGAGRWCARYIGRKAVRSSLRPIVEEGAEWVEKDAVATTAGQALKGDRPKPGNKVKLSKNYKNFSDATQGNLKPGEIGVVLSDDKSAQPIQVRSKKGKSWWYMEGALKVLKEEDDTKAVLSQPLGDDFEGMTFARFPISDSSWYAEVHVQRMGRTPTAVGWAVVVEEDGRMKIDQMALVDGKGARKLNIAWPSPEEAAAEEENKDEAPAEEEEQNEQCDEDDSDYDYNGPSATDASSPDAGKWDKAETYGERWQEGDVICCSVSMPGGKISFGLNGDFQAPMGEAFDLNLPEGSQLCLVVSSGDEGKLFVNIGQVAFANPPPSKEHRGLGEAMRIRPMWQVTLPKAVKAWPVFAGPMRSADGRKALKDCDLLEQADLLKQEDSSWLKHDDGWSPCKMKVVGQEYEALKPTPAWRAIDVPKEAKRKKKVLKRTIQATFDTELGATNSWNFRGVDYTTCTSGPTMLQSTESASTGILRWCLKVESGNKQFEVGVIPASQGDNPVYLHETCEIGLKSTGTRGADQLSAWDMYTKYVEVICDMSDKKVKFLVGEDRAQMVEVKALDVPFEEEIKLAVTGFNNFHCRLEPPILDRQEDSDESDDDDDDEVIVTTCGNAVQAMSWHVVTIAVDLTAGEMQVVLDGEPHLTVRDLAGLVSDGPLSIDPREGLMIFSSSRRGASSSLGELDWRAGGHLRSFRLDDSVLDKFKIWSQHLPKGIWICRCGSRNAADIKICWRCRNPRQKSGVRPPGDADPRHEGLTVLTTDSFRELVLEAKRHVFVMVSAPWCGACKQLEPRWHQLAHALSAEAAVTVAKVDIDDNELPARYFPETFIPSVKLFIDGKKRYPVAFPNAAGATFEELAEFLEQHTGIKIKDAIEKMYPAYSKRLCIEEFIETLRKSAVNAQIPRTPGRSSAHTLAAFLYTLLLDQSQDLTPRQPLAALSLERSITSHAGPSLRRAISGAGPKPMLVRHLSERPSMPGKPALQRTAQTTDSAKVNEEEMQSLFGYLDKGLASRLCVDLLDKTLVAAFRSAQPENKEEFASRLFLAHSRPSYIHRTFYNERRRVSWQRPPAAIVFVAAARILRFLMRWVRSRGLDLGLQQWAPLRITGMTAAAHRHNWRRVESAIGAEDSQHALADLGILLDRGYNVNAQPDGITALLLAAAVGNLHAAQFLFVHGADLHLMSGRPLLLPIEAAARQGHLRVVQLLAENGSMPARALHFAAACGALDVAKYLLGRTFKVSPDLRLNGLSAMAIALVAGQHRMACSLLPHCRPSSLLAPLQDEGCRATGLADGSTILHLAAYKGGLCESFVLQLAQDKELAELASMRNKSEQTALDLMASTLKIQLEPNYYGVFRGLGEMADATQEVSIVQKALADGAHASAIELAGFSLLDLACFCAKVELAKVLLGAGALIAAKGPTKPSALMWAHWSGKEGTVALLTSHNASLSNADLEGLQRLRSAWKECNADEGTKADKEKGTKADAETIDVAKDKAPNLAASLMCPDLAHVWSGCMPCSSYLASAKGLARRMAWGVGAKLGPAAPLQDTPAAPASSELVKAINMVARDAHLARSQLFALRSASEGSGLPVWDLTLLRLFLVDANVHDACCRAFVSINAQTPEREEAEWATEFSAAHAQVTLALSAVPAKKTMCFRACRVAAPGGTLRDLLRGNRFAHDCYRVGSYILWRHAASATTSPALAEELALRGEPSDACGVVFKIRRALGARPVAEFSEYPEQGEVVFPPGSVFRVVGLFPCTERCIRRGVSENAALSLMSVDIGAAGQRSDALNWDEACRSRSLVVVLDEEEASAILNVPDVPF